MIDSKTLFSTEQISKWHPDKYADQISDAILTECLRQDRESHCGIETMVKDTTVVLGGEVSTRASVDYDNIVHRVADKLGYKVDKIINLIGEQSVEIDKAVKSDKDIGAGDQGMMYGYACDDTESLLPYGFDLANKIIDIVHKDVIKHDRKILLGDAKTQVTTLGKDTQTVVVSACHSPYISLEEIRSYIKNLLVDNLPFLNDAKLLINPSGTWSVGGPIADCGLTGRKIVADQYGGYCPVGGGAFSGKDPSKVDRSASYMARHIACDVLKEFGLHSVCIQLAYAIGVAEPVGLYVGDIGLVEGKWNKEICNYIRKTYDLTPKGIINYLGLLDKDYEKIAEGCHYRERFF